MSHAFDIPNPDKEKAFLEAETLHLPSVDFSSSMYSDALRTHAAPIVDFLVQIEDAGIVRLNPVIADYPSLRGGDDSSYARVWTSDLANAINDLGLAADLSIAFVRGPNGTKFQLPEQFRRNLDNLQFSPALKRRVDARTGKTLQELDEQIRIGAEFIERIRNPEIRRRQPKRHVTGTSSLPVTASPHFTLTIRSDLDESSYDPAHLRQGGLYQYNKHYNTVLLT